MSPNETQIKKNPGNRHDKYKGTFVPVKLFQIMIAIVCNDLLKPFMSELI